MKNVETSEHQIVALKSDENPLLTEQKKFLKSLTPVTPQESLNNLLANLDQYIPVNFESPTRLLSLLQVNGLVLLLTRHLMVRHNSLSNGKIIINKGSNEVFISKDLLSEQIDVFAVTETILKEVIMAKRTKGHHILSHSSNDYNRVKNILPNLCDSNRIFTYQLLENLLSKCDIPKNDKDAYLEQEFDLKNDKKWRKPYITFLLVMSHHLDTLSVKELIEQLDASEKVEIPLIFGFDLGKYSKQYPANLGDGIYPPRKKKDKHNISAVRLFLAMLSALIFQKTMADYYVMVIPVIEGEANALLNFLSFDYRSDDNSQTIAIRLLSNILQLYDETFIEKERWLVSIESFLEYTYTMTSNAVVQPKGLNQIPINIELRFWYQYMKIRFEDGLSLHELLENLERWARYLKEPTKYLKHPPLGTKMTQMQRSSSKYLHYAELIKTLHVYGHTVNLDDARALIKSLETL